MRLLQRRAAHQEPTFTYTADEDAVVEFLDLSTQRLELGLLVRLRLPGLRCPRRSRPSDGRADGHGRSDGHSFDRADGDHVRADACLP